jgi:hypothetical protein
MQMPLFEPPLTPAQLRRLQTVWHAWTGVLELPREKDRRLRHYYVQLFSGGRATETRALTRADAATVIVWMERLVEHARISQAAGKAGRREQMQDVRVAPDAAAWRALWACSQALQMDRPRLDAFIAKHYGRLGLFGVADLRTMADLNRVLWGLKAIARRSGKLRRGGRDNAEAA